MRDVMVARWTDVGDKIVRLAEAIPEDIYEFRPVPEVRTFADQLRHLAFWNAYVRDTLRGVSADGEANELPREAYPDKTSVVDVLRESFGEVRAEVAGRDGRIAAKEMDTLVSFVEHAGEHYGQLAVYARLRGIVPPASRAEG